MQLNCLDYSSTNRGGACTHDGSTQFGLVYSYGSAGSNNGQIASIADSVDNGRSAAYTYDALYRLSTAATTGSAGYPAWGISMAYDRYGNRTDQNQALGNPPMNHLTIDATTNRISGDCYDASGNLLAESAPPCPSPTYTYDGENRLAIYSSAAAYNYDGNGLRIQKCLPNCTSPTSSTVYIFSGSKVIAEYDNGAAVGSPTREYIYSGGALLAKVDSSGTKYYQQDHLSNRLVTDSSGNTFAQLGHFSFGESWYNSTSDKLLFTTYERDSESGNDYALARYNMSRLARFSSPDPVAGSIADPQSLNHYAYTGNDPINFVDPLGLSCEPTYSGPPDDLTFEGWVCTDGGHAPDLPAEGPGGGNSSGIDALAQAAKDLSKKKLDKKNCQKDLAELGVSADQIRSGAGAANIINGVGSTVPLSSLYATSPNPLVQRNANSVTGTVGSYLASNPGVVAVSQLGGSNIYVNPGLISPGNYFQNLGTAFHEVVHNVTGLTDPDIQRALGLNESPISENITQKLIRDCL